MVRGGRRLVLVAQLLGVVPLVLHGWFALQGYFAHDDFVFIHSAMHEADGPGYLIQNHNGHVAPGAFALVWLVSTLAPLNFAAAMLPLLLMQAASYVVLWRLLVRCFGARWAIVVPYAVVTCSPVIHTSTLWWAYALQLIPLLLFTLFALDAHVRHVQTGRTSHLVAGLLWTVAGMAFYEKAVLIPFLMLGITVLLTPQHRVRVALREYRRTWILHGVLLAGYLAFYLSRAVGQVRAQDVEVDLIPELAGRMVVDSLLVPSLGLPVFGVPTEGVAQLVGSSTVVRIIAVALALVIVVAGCRVGKIRGLLAWTLLAGYLAADIALVVLTRLPMIGAAIGADLRYIADAVPIVALCAAFAFLQPLQVDAPVETRRDPRVRMAVVGLVVLASIGATISAVRLAPNMLFTTARAYMDTARVTVAQPGLVLYDSPVPDAVMIGWFGEDRMASRVLSTVADPPRFNVPAEHMYLLDDRGRAREITGVAATASGRAGLVEQCGYAVTDAPTYIPLSGVVKGKQLMRVSYYTASAGPATITAGPTSAKVMLEEGLHHLYLVVDGSYATVKVQRSAPVDAVCVDAIAIGQPITA